MTREEKKQYNANYRTTHREQLRAYDRMRGPARRSALGYSDYHADKVLRNRYGISLDQKRRMYDAQEGLCKLCGKPLPADFRKAHTDHDHNSKQIRGLIHFHCNKLVGFVEKNAELIGNIYIYLGWMKGKN